MTDATRKMRADLRLSKIRAWRELAEIGTPPTLTRSEIDATEHARRVEAEYHRQRARQDARRRLSADERGHLDPPEFLTVRERLARPRPPVQSRIDGWQPQGTRVVLAAQHKGGKTILVQNLARSLADGDLFLDRFSVTPVDGTVMVLDFEMSAAQLDLWFEDQRITHDDRVIVEPMKGKAATFDITDPAIRATWAERLQTRSVAYLVVDCLRPALDAIGLDENHDAGRFLVALDALLTEASIPECLLVHHMGHTNERSRGDSRILDWPDATWSLVREHTDDPTSTRFIKAYGRDVEQPEQRLAYDPATRRLSVDGGSRREQAAVDALDAVLEILDTATDALSVRKIQTALEGSEHSRDSVRAAIKYGIKTGAIATEPGLRNAILHRRNTQRAAVCGDRAAHTASDCASAYIDTHAHTVAKNNQKTQPARTLDLGNEPPPFRFDSQPTLDANDDDDHDDLAEF